MGKPNEIGAGEAIEIETAGRQRAHELSPPAIAYMALALCGVLAFAWFVATAWVFGLIASLH
ncbi:MAG: hypothetical protein ACHQAQ_15770 [Hyphomicrobiales bacterium]